MVLYVISDYRESLSIPPTINTLGGAHLGVFTVENAVFAVLNTPNIYF